MQPAGVSMLAGANYFQEPPRLSVYFLSQVQACGQWCDPVVTQGTSRGRYHVPVSWLCLAKCGTDVAQQVLPQALSAHFSLVAAEDGN